MLAHRIGPPSVLAILLDGTVDATSNLALPKCPLGQVDITARDYVGPMLYFSDTQVKSQSREIASSGFLSTVLGTAQQYLSPNSHVKV
jgi:hypothetical protein